MKKLTTKEIIIILGICEESIQDGLDIKYTLRRLENIFAKLNKADVIDEMRKRIFDSGSVGSGFVGILPAHMVEAISIGDERGHLDIILGEIKKIYEVKQNVSEKVMKAMAYPITVLSIMAVLLVGAFLFLIPRIKLAFKGIDPNKIPEFNKMLFVISDYLRGHTVGFGIVIVILLIAGYVIGKQYNALFYSMPFIRRIIIIQENAMAFLLMSVFYKAGINIQRAVESVGQSLVGPFKHVFLNTKVLLAEGYNISSAFKESGADDDVVIYIEGGELTEKVGEAFEKLSNIEIKKLDREINKTVGIINVAMMIIGGLSAIGLYAITLLPIYKIMGAG